MEDYARCLADKEWRMNNLYYIKVKEAGVTERKFRRNKYQKQFRARQHGRDIILKARQLGFSTDIQLDMLDDALFHDNMLCGIIAQTDTDAMMIFKEKIKFAYDKLPAHLRNAIVAESDSSHELRFANGSAIIVGVSLRSGTYHRLHISEYGRLCAKFPEKAIEVKTGTIPTVPIPSKGGTITIESTAEGRGGDFHDKCVAAKKIIDEGRTPKELEYQFHFFPWWEAEEYRSEPFDIIPVEFRQYFELLKREHDITLDEEQKSWYIQESRSQGEHMKREYPSYPEEAFEAAMDGAYFSRQMAQIRAKRQITRVPIVPGIPIQTFWDLGRDTTAIWFFQQVGLEWRFVDYYENYGESMIFYIQALKDKRDGTEPYLYGDAYLPHDGNTKHIESENSPADLLWNNGWADRVRIVQRTPDKQESINHARLVIPMCHFDSTLCDKGIMHLDNYRKEWDEKLSNWKKTPLHNEASHGADSFMTFADGYYHTSVVEEEGEDVLREAGRNSITGY